MINVEKTIEKIFGEFKEEMKDKVTSNVKTYGDTTCEVCGRRVFECEGMWVEGETRHFLCRDCAFKWSDYVRMVLTS